MSSSRQPRVATVIGPVSGSNPPWGAPRVDLAGLGYLVEEFQIEGTLTAYQIAPGTEPRIDGRWQIEPYGEAGYRTRLLVIRPADPARFNGTVVLNWQNVSAGVEGAAPADGEIYDGYAWVGVSAQEVGLYGFQGGAQRLAVSNRRPLVEHDPERYGELFHPGDQGSFDIFTQAGRAVGPARDRTVDPLGGLDVRRVIAGGGSQSAMRLVCYLNAFHPRELVFDAFLLAVWEGRAPRPEEGSMPMGVRTCIRTDIPTPVIVVNSEFEATHLGAIPIADTEHLRIWEVAGTPHGNPRAHDTMVDARGRGPNRLSFRPVHEAALRALNRWLTTDARAPAQPRIALDDDQPTIRRDERGNAIGGVRLPELAAPTHEYRGAAFGTGRAPLFGSARRFSDDELRALYPIRAAFTMSWCDAVDAMVEAGTLRAEDASATKARADEVELPVD